MYFLAAQSRQREQRTLREPRYCKFNHYPWTEVRQTAARSISQPVSVESQPDRQLRPSMPTEGQLSPMIQQRTRKRPTEPPAAPRRKLPQHAFHHKPPTACGSTAATPIYQCKSECSVSLHQNCFLQSEALQAQTITSLLQDASRAASMSKLVAIASPVSSAEHLLQRLRSGGVGARVNASNGHEQFCGKYVIPALTSSRPCHTGGSPHI